MSQATKRKGGMGRAKRSTSPMKEADRLFSLLIRARGRCEVAPLERLAHIPCAGPLQCAHGFSRSYHAVRWDERNAFAVCLGHHKFFTHRPLEWDQFLQDRMGPFYPVLRFKAVRGGKTDYKTLLADLRERTGQL